MAGLPLLGVLLMSASVYCGISPMMPADMDHEMVMAGDESYWLFWKHDDTEITMEIHVQTTGWVAFGISPDGGMIGSDCFTAGFREGLGYIQDRKATQLSEPPVDASQDVTLLAASEDNGVTVVRIKRKIQATDPDDHTIGMGVINVVWAYGGEDADGNGGIDYHSRRDSKSMQLLFFPPELTEAYTNHVSMGTSCDLYWKKDGDMVTFEVICKTTGYISFGISPRGTMVESDLVVIYILGGQGIHQDRYADEYKEPKIDPQNDWTLHDATEQDGFTRVKTSRAIQAGEEDMDVDIKCGVIIIAWAFGPKPSRASDNMIYYHGKNKGTTEVELFPCGKGKGEPGKGMARCKGKGGKGKGKGHDGDCNGRDCPCQIVETFTREYNIKLKERRISVTLHNCRDTYCIDPGAMCCEDDDDYVCVNKMQTDWCEGIISMKDMPAFLELAEEHPTWFKATNGHVEVKLGRHSCDCEAPKEEEDESD